MKPTMTRRLLPRLLALLALPSIGLAAAACGGSSGAAGAAGTDGAAAQAVPASAVAFVDANIDTSSSQFKQLETLGQRFPGWNGMIASLQQSLSDRSSGVSFEQDIKPWLGGEAGFALVGLGAAKSGSGTSAEYVAYLASTDDAKLEAALAKAGKTQKTGTYKGYDLFKNTSGDVAAVGKGALLVASDTATLEQAIDAREGSADSLADETAYKDTLAKLPKDNVAVGFVNGSSLAQLSTLAMAQAQAADSSLPLSQLGSLRSQLDALESLGLSVGAEDTGFRVHAVALYDPDRAKALGLDTSTFTPTLTSNVPSTAFAYIGFQNLGPMLEKALTSLGGSSGGLSQQLGALQQQTGLSLHDDLVPLLSNEHALYLAPGVPVTAALLLHPNSTAAAAVTLRKITRLLGSSAGLTFSDSATGDGQTTTASGLTVGWHRAGDLIAISNDPTAGAPPTDSLADSDTYKRVAGEAGMPDKVSGVVYLDIPALLQLSSGLGATPGASADASLSHLGPFLAYATADSSSASADMFLEVK
jgi:hypothetical protein